MAKTQVPSTGMAGTKRLGDKEPVKVGTKRGKKTTNMVRDFEPAAKNISGRAGKKMPLLDKPASKKSRGV